LYTAKIGKGETGNMAPEQFSSNEDFAGEVRRLLRQIIKSNQGYEEACVAFFGVTSSQGGALLALPLKKTLRMNELSNGVGVDKSTMTRMVDQLVDKGLVFRKVDEEDRRLVHIGLTGQGQQLNTKLARALKGFYKDSLGEIRENERAAIIRNLVMLNEAIARGVENCCKRYCNR